MTSSATTSAPVQPANSAAELLNDASMTPTEASVSATRADRLLAQFSSFRSELDAHQAQRERIVKLSRDVTALSKQLIFALHRVGSGRDMASVVREAEGKFKDLRGLFEKLQGEVTGADFWRYERSVSPGIQEYLEGFTFFYYLQYHSLPTLEEAQASLLPPPPPPPAVPAPLRVSAETAAAPTSDTYNSTGAPTIDVKSTTAPPAEQEPAAAAAPYYVHVTVDDYLGGVADLTGELMRLAIASVGKNLHASLSATATTAGGSDDNGTGGGGADFANIDRIGKLVREIKGQMDPLAVHARWLPKKLTVLDQSLAKIENASYNLRIRGAEYKDSPAMLQALARNMAEGSGGGGGGGGGRDRRGGDEVEASA